MEMQLQKSSNRYRFGKDKQVCLVSFIIRIQIPQNMVISEIVDVVQANVPFLIGLDFLDKYKLYVNIVKTVLHYTSVNIEIPLRRKHGQIYLTCNQERKVLYTRPELRKLHKTLFPFIIRQAL